MKDHIPDVLARAWSPDSPGGFLPPGPRMNSWTTVSARRITLGGKMSELMSALWKRGQWHRRDDGTVTDIACRPIPSAGGTYGIHTHLVIGDDVRGELAPGRYVYDHEQETFLRRVEHGTPVESCGGVTIVLSVQPARTFGRYRHRAWPLWIADVAYAWSAVEFLLGCRLAGQIGPSHSIRAILGVPSATVYEWWFAQDLVPEIPLVAMRLPQEWTLNKHRVHALAARRSARVGDFAPRKQLDKRARDIALFSGQGWVAEADHVETWGVSINNSARNIYEHLWKAHREAASLCYSATLTDRWVTRPVSGMAARNGWWCMHSVAMFDTRRQLATATTERCD